MPAPGLSETFREERGEERHLRTTWHPNDGQVVFSLWRGSACAGTFRLDVTDVPDLIDLLRTGLAQAYDQAQHGSPQEHEASQRLAPRSAHPTGTLTAPIAG